MSVVERIHERRIAPRVEADHRVLLTERLDTPELPCDEELLAPLFGAALNISETGILVEVDEPLCIGRRITVTVELDEGRTSLEGRIVRSSLVKGSGRVRLAVEFERVDAGVHEAIRKAIRRGAVCAQLN